MERVHALKAEDEDAAIPGKQTANNEPTHKYVDQQNNTTTAPNSDGDTVSRPNGCTPSISVEEDRDELDDPRVQMRVRQKSIDLLQAQTGSDEDLRRRSTSMVEAKDQTYRKLKEELMRAQGELQLKDQECGKLERVRDQMEQELEELTASLFEEANKMVQDANVKRMHTEKLLSEAQSSIEVLNAEVQALKALVLTSTPSEPNRHLHPQIDRKQSKEAPEGSSIVKKLSFKKTHKRSTSHHITKANPDFVFDATTPAPEPPTNHLTDNESFDRFKEWRDNPTLSQDSQFIARILCEDIRPCLSFSSKQLSERVLQQCETNNISIEPIPQSSQGDRECTLMQRRCKCSYKLRCSDTEQWQEICELARNRIIAVCELFTYLGYVKNGLIKNSSDKDMYWHIMDLRKAISLARLGFKS